MNTGAFVVGKGAARRFFRAGVKGGADIWGVLPPTGRLLCVETKRPGKKPTIEQEAFLEGIRAAGGVALVVSDVAALDAALAALG
jgi:hypothetical protein